MLLSYFYVAVGGALGSVARFWLSGAVAERVGGIFPLGTLIVNATGSFVIGFVAAFAMNEERWLVSSRSRDFVMIGVCGGYTTFSSFSLQTMNLLQKGEWLKAGANVILSVGVCLVAVWLGHLLGAVLNPIKSN